MDERLQHHGDAGVPDRLAALRCRCQVEQHLHSPRPQTPSACGVPEPDRPELASRSGRCCFPKFEHVASYLADAMSRLYIEPSSSTLGWPQVRQDSRASNDARFLQYASQLRRVGLKRSRRRRPWGRARCMHHQDAVCACPAAGKSGRSAGRARLKHSLGLLLDSGDRGAAHHEGVRQQDPRLRLRHHRVAGAGAGLRDCCQCRRCRRTG